MGLFQAPSKKSFPCSKEASCQRAQLILQSAGMSLQCSLEILALPFLSLFTCFVAVQPGSVCPSRNLLISGIHIPACEPLQIRVYFPQGQNNQTGVVRTIVKDGSSTDRGKASQIWVDSDNQVCTSHPLSHQPPVLTYCLRHS